MSPQSQLIYQKLLESNNPLTAKELALMLKIFPNTVYRLVEPLIEMGLITKTNRYPYQFSAKPIDEGLSLFLLQQNDWFCQQFFQAKTPESKQIQFSFIQSRDELFNVSLGETEKATKSIDLLRSGEEMPADLMLALTEAKKRKVITRMLIQDYSRNNTNLISNWKKNGILVRKTSHRQIRLMIYDAKIIYFMSYRHTDSNKDLGMKINYPPFAAILSQLFEQWWQKAETI